MRVQPARERGTLVAEMVAAAAAKALFAFAGAKDASWRGLVAPVS